MCRLHYYTVPTTHNALNTFINCLIPLCDWEKVHGNLGNISSSETKFHLFQKSFEQYRIIFFFFNTTNYMFSCLSYNAC